MMALSLLVISKYQKIYIISMVNPACVSPLPDLIVRVIQENKNRMTLEEWRKVGVGGTGSVITMVLACS